MTSHMHSLGRKSQFSYHHSISHETHFFCCTLGCNRRLYTFFVNIPKTQRIYHQVTQQAFQYRVTCSKEVCSGSVIIPVSDVDFMKFIALND